MFNGRKQGSNLSNEDKLTRRANLLYPSMKDKDKEEEKKPKKVRGLGEPKEEQKEEPQRKIKGLGEKDEDSEQDNRIADASEKSILDKKKQSIVKEEKHQQKMQNRADLLYPSMKDKDNRIADASDGVLKGGIEKSVNLENETKEEKSARLRKENEKYLKDNAKKEQFAIDHIGNPIIRAGSMGLKGREAIENLYMSKTDSYMNTNYAKKRKIYDNYNETPKELKEYFKNKISGQIGADKLEKTKGIFFDENDISSKSLKKNLLKDSEFIDKLKDIDSKNGSIGVDGYNWHNALGNVDIRNMHINKNGDVELYVTDVYDFNEGEKSNAVRAGRDRQDKGEITPYFSAYRVIIPKEEREKILKEK